MFVWIALAIFVSAAVVLSAWLIWEIHMDRIAQQNRDEWRELTRPAGERWPPHGDV